MDKLLIEGGNKLVGEVEISGSKNASLPIFFATLLTDKVVILKNVPKLKDIQTTVKLLEYLGKKIEISQDFVKISQTENISTEAPYELVKQMRASALVIGPILARYSRVKASLPGGCAIGARPINLHLEGFKKMGANVALQEGYVFVEAEKLFGAKIVLDYPSVGATENIGMAAVLAQGTTILENIAREPEIQDLCDFLNKLGASIDGIGTNVLTIKGVEKLNGCEHRIIPDRIEAGTFMLAAAVTKGSVVIKNANHEHLEFLIEKMKEAGVEITVEKTGIFDDIRVKGAGEIKPVSIETMPYPGFPTDMQAQWALFMSLASGQSIITETVFENRFMHIPELVRMGAEISIRGNSLFINGKAKLSGAQVMATDLRASASLVLAGLAAQGKTEISRIYHLDRGYENIETKLQKLGGKITRQKE